MIVDKLIIGNNRYFEELKRRIHSQPITNEAVEYNFRMAKNERKRSLDVSLGKHLQEKNLRSFKTYLTNSISE